MGWFSDGEHHLFWLDWRHHICLLLISTKIISCWLFCGTCLYFASADDGAEIIEAVCVRDGQPLECNDVVVVASFLDKEEYF